MNKLKSPRVWIAIVIVVGLIVVAVWPSSRQVDTAQVDRGPVREQIEAEGRTRVVDRYEIAAPVAALARRLLLEPGDPVVAGQVVVELDPMASTPLDPRERERALAAIAAARARLALASEQALAAAASAEQAEADAGRLTGLAARGLVAGVEAEQAQTARELAARALASARFAEASARHELELAEAALRFGIDEAGGQVLSVRSPVDGVLLRRHFESATPVQAGQALVEIGDPERLEAQIEVLSADAVRLREGMPVELLRWGGGGALHGQVRRIEPGGFTKFSALGVEEQRVWVIVELTSPHADWQRLGDAYRVHGRFLLQAIDDAVRVPTSALFRHGEGRAVFVFDRGRARLTEVTIGIEGEGYSEVRAGLDPGTTVIVYPDRLIENTDRVRAR